MEHGQKLNEYPAHSHVVEYDWLILHNEDSWLTADAAPLINSFALKDESMKDAQAS